MNATARAFAPPSCKTVVVIGAGFSGVVLTTCLLRNLSAPTQIVLVEQKSEVGRGIAYAKRDYPYLLNVPAARMSADSRDPLQFARFAKRRDPSVDGEDFLPRELYGDYLQSLLLSAKHAAPAHTTLTRITTQAQRIVVQTNSDQLRVELSSGGALLADDVVLATGNPPPAELSGTAELKGHPGYVETPWSLPENYSSWKNVLIVGTGLSMVDAAMQLQTDNNNTPRLHAISRRGLVPLAQSEFRSTALRGNGEALLADLKSLRKLTRSVRSLVKAVENIGGDWREVVTFVRNFAPHIWAAMPHAEQRRFIRHVQPHWDVHRHRLAPEIAECLAEMQRNSQLQVNAGRIESLHAVGEQIRVIWRRRGKQIRDELIVDAVINATGPDYRISATRDPLLRSLCDAGLIAADHMQLGLRTAADYSLIDAYNKPHSHLFYLGPMLRASHWEATAVAELRAHAEKLAASLAALNLQQSVQ